MVLRVTAGHLSRNGKVEEGEDKRGHITERPALRHFSGNVIPLTIRNNKRHGSTSVRSMRSALMAHLFRVPVVRGDHQGVVVLEAGGVDAADGEVGGLDGPEGGRVVAGMANHVGRREVG